MGKNPTLLLGSLGCNGFEPLLLGLLVRQSVQLLVLVLPGFPRLKICDSVGPRGSRETVAKTPLTQSFTS